MARILAPFPLSRRLGALALAVGTALALGAVHAEGPPEAAREGPSCVGCHHGADEEAQWPSLGAPDAPLGGGAGPAGPGGP